MPLPENVLPLRRTPTFTESTVPLGLLKAHSTKEGSWGLIHVLEGALAYRLCDPRRAQAETTLTPDGAPGVVEPTILHEVEPLGRVQFYVEFHRAPDSADAPDGGR